MATKWLTTVASCLMVFGCSAETTAPEETEDLDQTERWLAGDHHVHSHYSAKWRYEDDQSKDAPPIPLLAGDAIYPILKNVEMAKHYGLHWMVTTDHGGPLHSKLNIERAYPDVLEARRKIPEMVLFYGMEFDTPGAEHSTLILPHTHDEADQLFEIESRFNKREPFPPNDDWDTEERMNKALLHMRAMHEPPVVIANHPSRTMKDGHYTKVEPSELRRWNDTAPNVAIGMEGAPGHQARAKLLNGRYEKHSIRGGYKGVATRGGFDPMTAELGGFWDSMLGEGRRWWITATSDAHRNWRDGGSDFWPGEYSKTFVFAAPDYDAVLAALRAGRIFVATGDLVSSLTFSVHSANTPNQALMGETLDVGTGQPVTLNVGFCEPPHVNANGDKPEVSRVDVIIGSVKAEIYAPESDKNASSYVFRRLDRLEFDQTSDTCFNHTLDLGPAEGDFYIRLRGTNTDELEPAPDPRGEDPWSDLWFYSNPIFVSVPKH